MKLTSIALWAPAFSLLLSGVHSAVNYDTLRIREYLDKLAERYFDEDDSSDFTARDLLELEYFERGIVQSTLNLSLNIVVTMDCGVATGRVMDSKSIKVKPKDPVQTILDASKDLAKKCPAGAITKKHSIQVMYDNQRCWPKETVSECGIKKSGEFIYVVVR